MAAREKALSQQWEQGSVMGPELALQERPEPNKPGTETLNRLQVSGAKCVPPVSWLDSLTCSQMRGQINLVELGLTSQGRSFHWIFTEEGCN